MIGMLGRPSAISLSETGARRWLTEMVGVVERPSAISLRESCTGRAYCVSPFGGCNEESVLVSVSLLAPGCRGKGR